MRGGILHKGVAECKAYIGELPSESSLSIVMTGANGSIFANKMEMVFEQSKYRTKMV
jgi:hypothetical protein